MEIFRVKKNNNKRNYVENIIRGHDDGDAAFYFRHSDVLAVISTAGPERLSHPL